MTLRHFKIFIAVCESLNMTQAARQLHISQPSVTQAIHEQVKDGSVQKVVFWNFDRLSDEWRYQTSTMQKPNSSGHTNRVYPNSWGAYILKICIDYLR